MPRPFHEFYPDQVLVTFAGIPITGWADGEFITVARRNPQFNTSVGADGEGTRVRSNDRSGTVVIRLAQSSSVNDLLSALSALDEQSPNGDGIGPFLMKDLSGTTLVSAEKAWLQGPAEGSYGKETSNREWTIESHELLIFHGGN